MLILATITFRINNNNDVHGIIEYSTDDIVGDKFKIMRREEMVLEERYKLIYNDKEMNLSDYVHETEIIRIEDMYQKAKETSHLVCFTAFLQNWYLAAV